MPEIETVKPALGAAYRVKRSKLWHRIHITKCKGVIANATFLLTQDTKDLRIVNTLCGNTYDVQKQGAEFSDTEEATCEKCLERDRPFNLDKTDRLIFIYDACPCHTVGRRMKTRQVERLSSQYDLIRKKEGCESAYVLTERGLFLNPAWTSCEKHYPVRAHIERKDANLFAVTLDGMWHIAEWLRPFTQCNRELSRKKLATMAEYRRGLRPRQEVVINCFDCVRKMENK